MNKKTKILNLLIILIFFTSCSFDKKTGIWPGDKNERERISELEKKQKDFIEVISFYTSDTAFDKEVNSVKNITLTKPKANTSWTMSGLNLQNFLGHIYLSGIDKNFLKKRVGKNKFSLSKIMSTPIIFNDNIIFADDKGTVFSINQNGNINWKKNIYKKVYKKIYKNLAFSAYDGKVYVVDNIGFIYSINAKNGEIIWLKNHGIPIRSKVKILRDKIFLINQDNRLLCLDTEDGSKIWDIRSIGSFIKSQNFLSLAISEKENLIALFSSGDLLKINTTNGRVFWSLNATSSTLAHDADFFMSSDIVISGKDIFFGTSSSVFSYNLDTGYFNWQSKIPSRNTPIIDGSNVFVVSDNGYFVNLNRKSGEIIWSTNMLKILKEKKRKTSISGFVIGSGKVYAVTYNGYLIVCSAISGKVEYSKKIADGIITAPIINNNALYILTEDSKILGFK